MSGMTPIEEMPPEVARNVRVLFTDVDDTITTHGKITEEAFSALWALANAGVAVVPVTGRPAGWCDHIARMWPVAGVIGENGAFYFYYDQAEEKLRGRYLLTAEERARLAARFGDLGERILAAVPGSAVASDQAYRIHDLAIDFAEDVGPLPDAAVDRIVALFTEAGATAKVSSIHVNGWFGDYDKLGMIRRFAREMLGLDLDRRADRNLAVYAGDSPNDEPAFAFFENSVGVANVRAFRERLRHPPVWITRGPSGEGFGELARVILGAKG